MIHPANTILQQRAQGTRRTGAFVFSVVLHIAIGVTAFLVPVFMARAQPPIEFRTVTIVPVQALGVPDPKPRPEPVREAPPEPPRPAPPEAPRPTAPSPTATKKPEKQPERSAPPVQQQPEQRRGSPLGSDIASSPFGASGVGLDNPDFTYGYYIDQLVSMIGSAWVRPRVDGQIESRVFFRIARDGSVSGLKLIESSGSRAFDDAALRAVSVAAPLPPLPASYDADSLGVSLIVR